MGAKGIRITEAARIRQMNTIRTYLIRMNVVDLDGSLSPKFRYVLDMKLFRLVFRFMVELILCDVCVGGGLCD